MAKLKVGDFHAPGEENNLAVRVARSQFLSEVERIAPRVLDELAGLPFERFIDMLAQAQAEDERAGTYGDSVELVELASFEELEKAAEANSAIRSFAFELKAWSQSFRMDADWIRAEALSTIREWSKSDSSFRSKEWAEPVWIVPRSSSDDSLWALRFQHERWNPEISRWADYREKAQQAFETALEAYRAEVKAQSKEQGLKKTRHLRKDWHFEALARYVVDGESIDDLDYRYTGEGRIGKKNGDDSTVRHALKSKALLIGLPLQEK